MYVICLCLWGGKKWRWKKYSSQQITTMINLSKKTIYSSLICEGLNVATDVAIFYDGSVHKTFGYKNWLIIANQAYSKLNIGQE